MLSSCCLCLALLDMWASRGGINGHPSSARGFRYAPEFSFSFYLFCSFSLVPSVCPAQGGVTDLGWSWYVLQQISMPRIISVSIGRVAQPSVPRAFRFALCYTILCSSSSPPSSLFHAWFVFSTVTHHWDGLNDIYRVLPQDMRWCLKVIVVLWPSYHSILGVKAE